MSTKGIALRRYKRHKLAGDNTSPGLYDLQEKTGMRERETRVNNKLKKNDYENE